MTPRRFLISSLALAGLIKPGNGPAALPADRADANRPGPDPVAVDVFRQDHLFHLTGHSSHASHASHASGSGGGYYSAPDYTPPAPAYSPPPTPLYTPRSPLFAEPATRPLSGRTELFNAIVRRVQLGLQAYGYYDGVIDGVVGEKMRDALTRFQKDFNMKVTGTITTEVLNTFKIAAR